MAANGVRTNAHTYVTTIHTIHISHCSSREIRVRLCKNAATVAFEFVVVKVPPAPSTAGGIPETRNSLSVFLCIA